MADTVRVNFGRAIPVFPFHDLVLLPHESLPLHIFEPRYRQMIGRCLDAAGQFAIATTRGDADGDEPLSLREVACVGQIIQHEALPGGRFNVLLHGICRARIVDVAEPDGDRLYREARMSAVEATVDDEAALERIRRRFRQVVHRPRLDALEAADSLREWSDLEGIPTRALVDLFGFVLVRETERKYGLLAQPDVLRRARAVLDELQRLDGLIHRADQQAWRSWPRGMSWN